MTIHQAVVLLFFFSFNLINKIKIIFFNIKGRKLEDKVFPFQFNWSTSRCYACIFWSELFTSYTS